MLADRNSPVPQYYHYSESSPSGYLNYKQKQKRSKTKSFVKLIYASGVLTVLIFTIWFAFYYHYYLSTLPEQTEVSVDPVDHVYKRIKRDFMFVSDKNKTDPNCFQNCNDEWKDGFEKTFSINHTEFYDFPFHPTLLDYSNFLKYCELADNQTNCFINRCDDQSADRVFSPSNFVCQFKRKEFVLARPCLEETEPLTFLKCDQECHQLALKDLKISKREENGKVFSSNDLDQYERELNLLCSFQECYKTCHQEIVREVCSPALSNTVFTLINQYIKWHATDIYDWHILTDKLQRLPMSCLKLTGYTPQSKSVAKLITSNS
uniref:CPG4 domain-containing protein n=1 Tax=Rhabditophanes sp. KR3021 TaxID=114890 RepID=A0AC35U5R5_9BILA